MANLKYNNLPLLEMPKTENLGLSSTKLPVKDLLLPTLEMPSDTSNIIDIDKLPKLPLPNKKIYANFSLTGTTQPEATNIGKDITALPRAIESAKKLKNIALDVVSPTKTGLLDLLLSPRTYQQAEKLIMTPDEKLSPEDLRAKKEHLFNVALGVTGSAPEFGKQIKESMLKKVKPAKEELLEKLEQFIKPKKPVSVVGQEPFINIKKSTPAKDIYGNKIVLPKGEAYTPHKLNTGNVLLKDGNEFVVSSNQYQNIKGQNKQGIAKEFAPELKQVKETVKGNRIQYNVIDPSGNIYDAFETMIDAKNAAKNAGRGYTVKADLPETYPTQQAIKITPEIKAMVKGEAFGKQPSGIAPSLIPRSASGVIAGFEPEYDKEGKPTGRMKFNPAKAALGVGAIGLMGGIKDINKEKMGIRQFIESVKTSPITNPKVVERLSSELYKVRNTAEGMAKADLIVKNFPYQAKAMIVGNKIDDAGAFISQALIKQAQVAGNYDEAVQLTKELARKATESGRFSQALSAYNKLSPEGILRYAQSVIDEANAIRPDLKLSIQSDTAKKFVNMATEIGKMVEGIKKQQATQRLLGEILSLVPPTIGQQISTLQTMAQLINFKTIIRNVVGNTIFGGLENVNQAVVATPIDKLLSLATGKRTTLLPSVKTQKKGFLSGLKEGYQEAVMGIPSKVGTQYELNKVPVFRDKILGSLEKVMNVSLRAPDRAAYRAAFDDSIRQQLQISKVTEITGDMIEQAHQAGLYRTFQDENVVSGIFVGMKKALNTGWSPQRGVFTMNFGLGDVLLKYPKTPGNILARSIDYSPIGIVNSIFQAGKGLKSGEFNQKAFVDSFSRGITGTAGIAGAAVLAKLGIISALPSKDRDIRDLQKLSGEGAYQVNASALYRLIQSGFAPDAAKKREGDTLVTYDWAQPVATNIALGAKFAEAKNPQKTAMDIGDVLTTGTETLAEQPLVSSMRRFFGGYKPGEAVAGALKSVPASFTPTLLKQTAQVFDPYQRQSRSNEMFGLKESLNMALAKIPVVSKTLPPRIGVFGKKTRTYQKGEAASLISEAGNLFNIFLNPSFITKYKPNKEAQEVIRLMESTGETKQFPKSVSPTIRIGKGSVLMTPDQQNSYQKMVGIIGQKVINQFLNKPEYTKLKDEDKVKEISNALSEINRQVKQRIMAEIHLENISKIKNKKDKLTYLKGKEKLKMLTPEIFQIMIDIQNQKEGQDK